MIFRQRRPTPAIFVSDGVRSEADRLRRFFVQPIAERAQRKFRIHYEADNPLREHVAGEFSFKCAYCEQPAMRGAIDRFRPTQHAMGLDGKVDRDHYWWLHFEWNNLYWACPDCNRHKRNVFPVDGERSGPGCSDDTGLLIDPCRDWPQEHFVFDKNGRIHSKTRRGDITIQVLQLNREDLVRQRSLAYSEVEGLCGGLFTLLDKRRKDGVTRQLIRNSEIALLKFFDDDCPDSFLLLRRQYVAGRVEAGASVAELQTDKWRAALGRFGKGTVDVQESNQRPVGSLRVTSRQITRVEIHNFRVIEHLELDFKYRGGDTSPWLMLLGENGCGKTSVLRAIALTLMGNGQRNRLQLDARSFLNKGTKTGWVKVHLSGSEEPVELSFRYDQPEFFSRGPEVPFVLLGYGHTRSLPAPHRKVPQLNSIRVQNLFRPATPLLNAEGWLAELEEPKFDLAAMQIKKLLGLDDEHRLERVRNGGSVRVHLGGIPLEELSSGYQAVVSLAADVMMVVQRWFGDIESGTGIVLLDEIDAHLHPRWKMRIVQNLREIFPYLQFVVTSHEPLCLRGMRQGEVAVMQRRTEELELRTEDLPATDGMEVDQLLTSPFFGLGSTIDPVTEALMNQYYFLLSRGSQPHLAGEIATLEHQLSERNARLLGATPREQLLYKAIDTFLAEQTVAPKQRLAQLDKDFWDRLRRVWGELGEAKA